MQFKILIAGISMKIVFLNSWIESVAQNLWGTKENIHVF
jgi:hypothetical protein